MDDKNAQNILPKYLCNYCDYVCSRTYDWSRHISTTKHKKKTNLAQFSAIINGQNVIIHKCNCGKEYISRQGLWKHKKLCDNNIGDEPIICSSNEELLYAVLKDNQEFKQLLIEQNTKLMELASANTVITNNNITHNNTTNNFNLQMFLNVECKDALNMSEFVDSLQVQIQDLELTGRLGYVEGISNIFLNGLKGLDINKRPIHCSDQKREILYIKDKDIWEKETDDRHKIKNAIKMITAKNIRQIPLWQKDNPEWSDSSSKVNDKYLKIVSNAMNGSTVEETQKNYDKIISKLAKNVVIQK
jgi:hypothetical protein